MGGRLRLSVFGIIFGIIILAEILATLHRVAGLFLHFTAIFIAVFYVIFLKRDTYVLTLILPPVLRVINFSMPVFFPYTIYWFPLVYSPIFASVYMVVRALNMGVDHLGINLRKWYIYIPAGVATGIILAFPEFMILRPECLIPDFGLKSVITLCVVMYVFVALAEELVFRSVIQSTLEREFGLSKGLLMATGLFAIMHVEYGLFELAFAFLAGLVMGCIFQRTRSLLFVTTIHGTVNVMVFGLFHLELFHLGLFT